MPTLYSAGDYNNILAYTALNIYSRKQRKNFTGPWQIVYNNPLVRPVLNDE